MNTHTALRVAAINETLNLGVHPTNVTVTDTTLPPTTVPALTMEFTTPTDADAFADALGLPTDDGLTTDYTRSGVTPWGEHTVSVRVSAPRPTRQVTFNNGYAASIAPSPTREGWEVAVYKHTADGWAFCYDTPITGDVVWCPTAAELDWTVKAIRELPATVSA